MLVILIGFLFFGVPGASDDFLGGDGIEYASDTAVELFEAEIGASLPEGVVVLNYYEGGFQDRFVQIKLAATDAGLASLIATLPLGPPTVYVPYAFGISEFTWWDAGNHAEGTLYVGRYGSFPQASLLAVADPARPGAFLVYLMAFET